MRLDGCFTPLSIVVLKFLTGLYVPGSDQTEVGMPFDFVEFSDHVGLSLGVVEEPALSTIVLGSINTVIQV